MNIERSITEESIWESHLHSEYERGAREGVHVSDLTLCLRPAILSKKYSPKFETETLFRFTMGRAMEKSFFEVIANRLGGVTQELEVEKDGIVGHIDFASDVYDYECKLTWGREPKDNYLVRDFKTYWLDQAGAYTYMRGRTKMKFIVCYIKPNPRVRCYEVEWTQEELEELWQSFLSKKKYVEDKVSKGEMPMKTVERWLCNGCAYKEPCDSYA